MCWTRCQLHQLAAIHNRAVATQVSQTVGAAQCAHGLRKMYGHLGSKQLSEQQLRIAVNLAESLVASLEEVRSASTPESYHPSS